MTSPSAVDMSRPSAPTPKGPPASFMPTPGDVQQMTSSSPAADPRDRITADGKYKTTTSATDIDWTRPLHEQLEPNLKGGRRASTSYDDLCMLRAKIPKLSHSMFQSIFPCDNNIRVVQKSHGEHHVKMSEVAAWVLSATHWYALLRQPMMVVVWCHGWIDASRFQYLMQILQVQYQDYVPKYHIFVEDSETVKVPIQTWQHPTTLWDGQPVLGFMAETYLDDLPIVGFKDFNPMWTFPTTSVNQCWDPITFRMAPWHLDENVDKQRSREALQSQSPIAAFKACNVIQSIGIAYSKIVLPSRDSKGEAKHRTYCPTTWTYSYQWQHALKYTDQLHNESLPSSLLCKERTLLVRIQLSKKSASHPQCAFADSASTVMYGAMVSLTPCIAPTCDRECDLEEYAEFEDLDDMITKLNGILSKSEDFPRSPFEGRNAIHWYYRPTF